jgi:pimeloyl-ACP methyl ester carboxylesterase
LDIGLNFFRNIEMTAFVLVHGAWGGAHGFRHVRRLLRSAQHDVSTPSLTGVGERIHLSSPLVGLGTHIRDVVNHVIYEDLQEIVLVGFSYGGFVVTGALEHIAERVSHLVYLDAFVPSNGETVWSHVGREARAKIELGQEWLLTGPVREYDSPTEAAWMGARRTTHPQACFTEPVFLAQPLESFPSPGPISRRHRLQKTTSVTRRSGGLLGTPRGHPLGVTTRSLRTIWSQITGPKS